MSTTETPRQILLPVPDNPFPTRAYAVIAAATAIAFAVITLFSLHPFLYFCLAVFSALALALALELQPSLHKRGWKLLEDFARSNDFALRFPNGFVYDPDKAELFARSLLGVAAAGPYQFVRFTIIAGDDYMVIER